MKIYALDTNCFIDAVNPTSPSYNVMQHLLAAYKSGKVSLRVSLQTLHQLEERQDEALKLARTLPVLPTGLSAPGTNKLVLGIRKLVLIMMGDETKKFNSS